MANCNEYQNYECSLGMREALGRRVREAWVSWAEKQPNPKPHHLEPYDTISEADREADRVIGEQLYRSFLAAIERSAGSTIACLIEGIY